MGPMATIPPPGAAMIRQSSGEQAAVHIRRLIFDGELRPGDRVPQDEIAHTLGISRIPVREALIALEREGWVTIEMHRGAFISAIDAQAVRDHYELYGLVYGFAARRALARDDPELIERLNAIEQRLVPTDDPEEMGRLSVEFLAAALVPGNFFSEVPGAMDVQRRGLPAVLRAMRRGDGDRAAAEYLRLMRRMGDKVVQRFKERGLFDPSDAAA